MDVILSNPIAMLFLSFAFGAVMHGILSSQDWYKAYYNFNFLSDRTTKSIGVLWIEWLITNSPLRFFNQQLKIAGRPSKADLLKLRTVMTAAELSHLIAFVLILFVILYYFLMDKTWGLITLMTILNVLFNGYTALTQQYNKRRLDKLIRRIDGV